MAQGQDEAERRLGKHAHPEKIELGPSEHLSLEHLQSIDLAFDLAITPHPRARRDHGGFVTEDPAHEACQLQNIRAQNVLQPWVERLGAMLAEQVMELLHQALHLGHGGTRFTEDREEGLLVGGQLKRFTTKRS